MIDALGSLVLATLFLLGSPGPAPLSLAAVGATVGVRNGIPFLAGILTGLLVCITAAGFGIAILFESYPEISLGIQLIGGLYLLWIAYKIGSAPQLSGENSDSSQALNFRDGFIVNLFNPKAYIAFFALFSQFLLPLSNATYSFLVTGFVCFVLAVVIDAVWLVAGSGLRSLFSHPRYHRVVRIAFAVAIIVATIVALLSGRPG